MSESKATSITRLSFLNFPAYLVVDLNGGFKLRKESFINFEQRLQAKCPFSGGWADMSVQKRTSGIISAKVNLRFENTDLTIRVDNAHGEFHLDIERNHKKIEKPKRIILDPNKPQLLSSFEIAKQELLQRTLPLLPTFGSRERPTLDMLLVLLECKFTVNNIEIPILLPPYPGAKLSFTPYTPSNLPIHLDLISIKMNLKPFDWKNHTKP